MASFIDEVNLMKSIEKIELYKKQKLDNFEKIKKVINNLNNNYVSNNEKDLLNKFQLMIKEEDKALNNVGQYIELLDKTVEKYRNIANNVKDNFKNMR